MAETLPQEIDLKTFVHNALRGKGSAFGLIVFFSLVGLPFILLGYGAYQAYGFWDLRTNGVPVKATIVRFEEERMGSSLAPRYYPIISYDVNGVTIQENRAAVIKRGQYKAGQVVDAFYDAKNPSRVMLDNLKHHMTGFLILLLLGAAGCAFVYVTLRTILKGDS